jgi:hypothetical protein
VSQQVSTAGETVSNNSFTPSAVTANPAYQHRPEFIRLPRSGTRCPWTGLSRTKLNELVLPSPSNEGQPPVKSKSERKPGKQRGIRLINFESLLAHLNSQEGGAQ